MPVRALNLYYARDDCARAPVLATRLHATDVREHIGIPRGRVLTRVDGDVDLPDVLWDCPFADASAHDGDMQARAASAEFEACRAAMRTLTRRFERVIYEVLGGVAAPDVGRGEHVTQIWMSGRATLDMPALHSLGATTVLHRADDNASLPDWIVEMPAPAGADRSAAEAWIAHHWKTQSRRIRWRRAA